tara:strand:+ start:309 stop:824 length:516 start_codon:yes stop_codon:yes gene_type:complete
MEINNPEHKRMTIKNWKRSGVLYGDFDELYDTYIKTMNCTHCGKVFETTKERHLDHCHETGLFRKIVCQGCNTRDTYINYPAGIPSKSERNKKYKGKKKEYYENNKEKIIEKSKEYAIKNKEKKKEYEKEYHKKNRDKINEYMKEYREKNRDKLNENQRKKRKEKKELGLI